MSSDITLAVGDGARRMTYVELAAVRGTSPASAQRLVRRRHWPRQTGNDGVVRVLVPLDEARTRPETLAKGQGLSPPGPSPQTSADSSTADSLSPGPSDGQAAPDNPRTSAPDIRGIIKEVIREIAGAAPPDDGDETVRTLETAVTTLREQLAVANQRIDELKSELATERRRVIEILTQRRSWWRRWFR